MISSMHSSAAARPTSGCEPAPRPSVTWAPSWISLSAFDIVSACASVLATTNSTPRRPAVIMLFTALPPPPPTPNTVMRGFSSVISGFCRLIVIVLVLFAFRRSPLRPPMGLSPSNSKLLKTVPQPLTHTVERAAGARHPQPQPPTRLNVLQPRNLRINQQADRGGKSWTLRRLRQARHAERAADPHISAQNPPGRLRQAGQLAGAAGQHDPFADGAAVTRLVEPVAQDLQCFLDAGANDARHHRARHLQGHLAVIIADRLDRDEVAVVGASGKCRTVHDLQALRVVKTRREPARHIHRHMAAADRDRVGMHELAVGKDGNRCRAAAHVNARGPHFHFIVDEGS